MKPYELESIDTVTQAEQTITPFATENIFSGDVSVSVQNLNRAYTLDDLAAKTGFLMISVKNKNFSNRLIERFLHFVKEFLSQGLITIVDTPYLHNIHAMDYDPQTKHHEIAKLERISRENQRRIDRLLRKHSDVRVQQVQWRDLEAATPAWIEHEVNAAFASKGNFYRAVIERTREVLPDVVIQENNVERYAQFLVSEMPVLCHQYYFQDDSIVDIYPGENPDFLWLVETGHYADELPRLSAASSHGSGLIYVDFRMLD